MTDHVIDRLSAYLDAELPSSERAKIESHLRACTDCARHLEDLAAVDEAARGIPATPPEGYFAELPARIRQRLTAAPAPKRTWRWAWPVWAGAAAAVILVAVITPLTWNRSQPEALPQTRIAGKFAETEASVASATPAAKTVEAGVGQTQTRSRPPAAEQAFARGDSRLKEEAKTERNVDEKLRSLGYVSAPPDGVSPPGAASGIAPPPPAAAAPRRTVEFRDKAVAEPSDREEVRLGLAAGSPPVEVAEVGREAQLKKAMKPKDGPATVAPRGKGTSFDDLRNLLDGSSPRSADEARALADALQKWLATHPDTAEADEVRVRIVQALAAIFGWSGERRDLATARRAAESYLARSDARQADRVRAILAGLPTEP